MTNSPLPKISIVTPSFNQDRYLEHTLQSVLSQGYPNLEYVVIDGGSTDRSPDIIERYENQLSYWVSEQDDGHGHALNKGFAHTTGEIMAWINSDDMYTPWALATVAEIFATFPHVNWVVGFNAWWNSAGAMTNAMRVPKNKYDYLLGRYAWVQQESVFWRRSLWDKAGGFINQDYRLMVDGELWTRFFLHDELYTLDCVLGGYRKHTQNRAGKYYADCCREMETAISQMKTRCAPEVLHHADALAALQDVPGEAGDQRGVNAAVSTALTAAAYRNICWADERWVERTLPFEEHSAGQNWSSPTPPT